MEYFITPYLASSETLRQNTVISKFYMISIYEMEKMFLKHTFMINFMKSQFRTSKNQYKYLTKILHDIKSATYLCDNLKIEKWVLSFCVLIQLNRDILW